VSTDPHERARKLIAWAGPEGLSGADQAWLAAHLETCGSCHAFAENARETIHALRAISIAAERTLVSTTQMRVRRRSLELHRQRERRWLVSVCCAAVTLCALVSAAALWRGFEWLGERAQMAPLLWQAGFFVFCVTPALVAAVLLMARDTHLADHAGSYQG
jgi:peptidoglycan biosynthesis protein MviN/MurJ (putative lipid II flippase)